MSTAFPAALDAYTNPLATTDTSVNSHAGQHANANDALVQVETKLGTGASTAAAGTLLRGTGAGTSAFGKLNVATDVSVFTSANLAAIISDETGSGSAVFGTSPTLTTPVIASIVNTGTLTLPTTSDTLVGRATTDTLTAKSIDGGTNTLTNTPGVELGAVSITASPGTFSTVETTILTLTVTVPAGGRNLRLEVKVPHITSSVPDDRVVVKIKETSTVIQAFYLGMPTATSGWSGTLTARIVAPSAGSHTYLVTCTRDVGTGVITWFAGASGDKSEATAFAV